MSRMSGSSLCRAALLAVIAAATVLPTAAPADWNQTTITTGGPGITRTLSMVHIAMFDSVNALDPRFESSGIALRSTDGKLAPNPPYTPGDRPGDYQLTPPDFAAPVNVGAAQWVPFAMTHPAQFRGDGPTRLRSPRYRIDFEEVWLLGAADSPVRTADETLIANWHTEQAQFQLAMAWTSARAEPTQGAASLDGRCLLAKREQTRPGDEIVFFPASGSATAGLIEKALTYWRRCEGHALDFPRLVVGEPGGSAVAVRVERERPGEGHCGVFRGRTITVFRLARIDEHIARCPRPMRILAHEIGHVLGLSDVRSWLDCPTYIMAPVVTRQPPLQNVQEAECRAVGRLWSTTFERGGDTVATRRADVEVRR